MRLLQTICFFFLRDVQSHNKELKVILVLYVRATEGHLDHWAASSCWWCISWCWPFCSDEKLYLDEHRWRHREGFGVSELNLARKEFHKFQCVVAAKLFLFARNFLWQHLHYRRRWLLLFLEWVWGFIRLDSLFLTWWRCPRFPNSCCLKAPLQLGWLFHSLLQRQLLHELHFGRLWLFVFSFELVQQR